MKQRILAVFLAVAMCAGSVQMPVYATENVQIGGVETEEASLEDSAAAYESTAEDAAIEESTTEDAAIGESDTGDSAVEDAITGDSTVEDANTEESNTGEAAAEEPGAGNTDSEETAQENPGEEELVTEETEETVSSSDVLAAYADGETTETGTFSDVYVNLSGYDLSDLNGYYTMVDSSGSVEFYLDQLYTDSNGEVTVKPSDTCYSYTEETGVKYFYKNTMGLSQETTAVRIRAVETLSDGTTVETVTETYERSGIPDVTYSLEDKTAGAASLFVDVSYTGNLYIKKYNWATVDAELSYGTSKEEASWTNSKTDSESLYYSDAKSLQFSFSNFTANTTYYGKLTVGRRVYNSSTYDYEFIDGQELSITFTTKEDTEYNLIEKFPDDVFRSLIVDRLSLGETETIVKESDLEKITYLSNYRSAFDSAAIKDITGVELLSNLTSLSIENHEIADVSKITWPAKLEALYLTGNELTDIPDVHNCANLKYLYLDENLISAETLAGISSKLPSSDVYVATDGQRTDGLQVVYEDTYYKTNTVNPLIVKLSGYKTALPYTFRFTVDGAEVTLEKNYDNLWYNYAAGLAVGNHTLSIAMYGADKDTAEKTVENLSFAVVEDEGVYAEKNLYYFSGKQDSFSMTVYSDKAVTSASLQDANGNVAAKNSYSISSWETSYEYRYQKLSSYGVSIEGYTKYQSSLYLQSLKDTTSAGTYDLVLTYSDGTSGTLSGIVEITDNAVITSGQIGYDYDSMGNYFYLQVNGYGFDPAKLEYSFANSSGTSLTASYVNSKAVSNGYIVKLKKSGDWSLKEGSTVTVTVKAKSGYEVTFQNDTFSAYVQSGIFYIAYNEVTGKVEVGVTSDYALGTISFTLERYSSYNDIYNDVSPLETIDVTMEDKTDNGIQIAYLTPMKDGVSYTLPSGSYYKVAITGEADVYGTFSLYSSSTNYWSGDSIVEKGTDSSYFYYYTDLPYSDAENYKFTAKVTGDSISETDAAAVSVYENSSALANISIKINTSELEEGSYTVTLYKDTESLSSRTFQVKVIDKFYITSSYLYADWIDDDSFELQINTLGASESDSYEVRLTDYAGNVVENLTTKVSSVSGTKYAYLEVSGLKRDDAYKYYYIYVTKKIGDEYVAPITVGGSDYFSDEKGSYTRIYNESFGYTTSGGKMVGIRIPAYITFPLTISIYKPYDTELLKSVTVKKTDLTSVSSSYGWYYFTQGMISGLSDADALYDVVAVDADGRVNTFSEKNLGYRASSSTTKYVTGITLNKTTLDLLVGATATLSATVAPSNATNKTLSWSFATTSGNDVIAFDEETLTVTAKNPGTAVVTAEATDGSGVSASCTVTVSNQLVTGIKLNKSEASLTTGDTLLLTATVTPSNATDQSLTWESSDEEVATVSEFGSVTAVGAGTATITVKANDDSGKSDTCEVTVKNKTITGVSLNTTEAKLYIGPLQKQTLTAAVTPADASIKNYEWKVEPENIVTISGNDASCEVTPYNDEVEAGKKATVTVTVTDQYGTTKSASCIITTARETVTISGLPTGNVMYVGKKYSLTSTVTPGGSASKVDWSSSDENVAAVTSSGLVTAKAEGTATITAKTERGGEASVAITVKQSELTGITLNKESLSLNKGDSTTLSCSISPSNLKDVAVTWTVSDNDAEAVGITVNEDGTATVSANNPGSATVTATATEGGTSYSAACTVTVHEYGQGPEKEIVIDISNNDVANITRQLYVTDASQNSESKRVPNSSITWRSSNEGVAAVTAGKKNDYAEVSAAGIGEATIYAAIKDGPTLSYKITVVNTSKIEGVDFTVNSVPLAADENGEYVISLAQDETKTVKAFVKPQSNTIVKEAEWSVSGNNPLIAITEEVSGNNVYAATISGNNAEAGNATVKFTLKDKNNGELLWTENLTVEVTKKAEVPDADAIPEPIDVITNVYPKVGDFPLSEKYSDWAWDSEAAKMSLSSFVGEQSKEFAAVYKGGNTYPVSLNLTKLTKVSISGNDLSSVMYYNENDGNSNKISLSPTWTMNGNQLKDDNEVLKLLKAAGMEESEITWTSSKSSVAEVDVSGSNPTLTLKKAGTAKITLTVKVPNKATSNYSKFTANYTINVVDKPVAKITVEGLDIANEDGTESSTIVYDRETKANNTQTLTVTLENATSLTAASSNTNVVGVKKVKKVKKEGEKIFYDLTLTVKAAGTAKLTLKANDKYNTTKEILLNVKDPYPVLSASSVTVNPKRTAGTAISIFPNNGYTVVAYGFMDNKTTDNKDDSKYFDIDKVDGTENEYAITAFDDKQSNGTYKNLALRVVVKEEGENGETYDYNLPFSIKVKAAAPSYSVKQTGKVNLFYTANDKDGRGNGTFTITTNETITDVSLEDCDYIAEVVEDSGNKQFTIKVDEDKYGENAKNRGADKKGTLKITFDGYVDSSAAVTKSFTVSTVNTKEKLTADKKTVTFYPNYGVEKAVVSVQCNSKALTQPGKLTLTQKDGTAIPGETEYGYGYTVEDGKLEITYDGATAKKEARISYQEDGWFAPLTVAITLNQSTKKPAVKLSKSTLTLNVNAATIGYDQALSTVTWKDGGKILPNNKVTISAANTDAKTALKNGYLGFVIGGDGTGEITAKLLNNSASSSWIKLNKSKNLKFKVAVEAGEDYTVTTSLTVKVLNKAPSVTASVKGSINVLNRASYATVTPKLNNINGTIVPENEDRAIKLIGESAHLFEAVLDEETGKILISLNDTDTAIKNVITNYNYKIVLSLNIKNEDGEVITLKTGAQKIKLTQTKPTLKVAAASNVIYSGVYNGIDLTFTAVNKDGTPVKIEGIELLNNTDLFTVKGNEGSDGSYVVKVSLNKNGPAAKGKSYSLKFKYTLKGQADNVSVYTVTQKVTVK